MTSSRNKARISIHIEGKVIRAARFSESVMALLGILREVTKDVCGSSSAMDWSVFTDKGSAVFGVEALPTAIEYERDGPKITRAVVKGIQKVSRGRSSRPARFSEKALRQARTLAELAAGERDGITRISITADGGPVELTDKVVVNISTMIGEETSEFGTIEGHLEMLSGHGQLSGRVYDDLTDCPVSCVFPQRLLEDLKGAWKRRVSISGTVHYSADGVPKRLDATEIRVFRDPSELPRWQDLRGILSTR